MPKHPNQRQRHPGRQVPTTPAMVVDPARLASIIALLPPIVAELRQAGDRMAMTDALAPLTSLVPAERLALVQALGQQRGQPALEAADVCEALAELSPDRATAKEARRAVIRLRSTNARPTITVPPAAAMVTAMSPIVTTTPQFHGAWASQTRYESEVTLIMAWTRASDPQQIDAYVFELDFWRGNIARASLAEPMTPRRFEREVLDDLRQRQHMTMADLTLGQSRSLLEEILDQQAWRKITFSSKWHDIEQLIDQRVMSDEVERDDSATDKLLDPGAEPDEVMVNYTSAWSFGDFGLTYSVLSERHVLRERETRDAYIALRRQWYDEAHPARLRIGAVAQQTQEQSGLWVPTSGLGAGRSNWTLFWSLELQDTPIGGQLAEMPMATLVNPDNGRHWFWQSITMERDARSGHWRVGRIRDDGAAAQAKPVDELLKRSDELWQQAETTMQEVEQSANAEASQEQTLRALSLVQESLANGEAALMRLPGDRALHEKLRERDKMLHQWDRAAAIVHRMLARFQNRLRDLLDLSMLDFSQGREQANHEDEPGAEIWLTLAINAAREALALDRTSESLNVLAELLISNDEQEEAEQLLRESLELTESVGAWADLGDLLMQREEVIEAVTAFEHAQRLEPQSPQIRWRLGRALEMADRLPEARVVYEDAVANDDGDAMAHSLLGNLLYQQREYDAAYPQLEQALRLGLVSPQVLIQLADIDANRGQFERARVFLEQATKIDPSLAEDTKKLLARLRTEEERQRRRH